MPHFKYNTFHDGEKSTKMRLSRSSGNFYILGKILSVQIKYRTSLKLRHMHFISADNFAHPVIFPNISLVAFLEDIFRREMFFIIAHSRNNRILKSIRPLESSGIIFNWCIHKKVKSSKQKILKSLETSEIFNYFSNLSSFKL